MIDQWTMLICSYKIIAWANYCIKPCDLNSLVYLSAPTIMWPRVRIPCTTSMLFIIYIWIVMWLWGRDYLFNKIKSTESPTNDSHFCWIDLNNNFRLSKNIYWLTPIPTPSILATYLTTTMWPRQHGVECQEFFSLVGSLLHCNILIRKYFCCTST